MKIKITKKYLVDFFTEKWMKGGLDTITLEIPDSQCEQVEKEEGHYHKNKQICFGDCVSSLGMDLPSAPELPEEIERTRSIEDNGEIDRKIINIFIKGFDIDRQAINQLIRYLKARE